MVHIITDSRTVSYYPESIFFALKSPRNDGHKYIRELYERGLKCFVISNEETPLPGKDACFILVKDTLSALQELAKQHRSKFYLPLIAVTGSNGKTIVKEWLYQLLKDKFSICRNPKSYNSQIGVPLSVWNLRPPHNLGIFEAGISTAGEMKVLADILQPRIGVFTGIGEAHSEGFKNTEEKIQEKFLLFRNCEIIVIQGLKKDQIPELYRSKKIILIGEESSADIRLQKISPENTSTRLELVHNNTLYSFTIPFIDRASILNAITCFGTLVALEKDPKEFENQFKNLQAIALRLEIKNGINNSVLINDFYNSDLDSLRIALNHLQQQSRSSEKTLILSDIEQSGQSAENLYKEIADLLKQYNVAGLIGIGKVISSFSGLFPSSSRFFQSTEEFISAFPSFSSMFHNNTILLKGARSFGFERISHVLQLKSHDTVLEINLNHIVENINYYKALLKPGTGIMCMVKAMGYGSGSSEIARTLQHNGIQYLAVAYADEGVELRQANIALPVMVMSPEIDSLEDIITYQLEPEIYSFRILEAFCRALDRSGVSEPYPVHLKIDTGMHRLGFEEKDLQQIADTLKKNPQLKVQSVFSHLVASDNPALDDFTKQQISSFEKACAAIEKSIGYSFIKHICNSGGISRFRNAHYDMVRLGIGMYGVGINAEEQKQLQNAGALKTRISQIKTVSKGETVGYNRNGKAEKDMTIATIPIGYADGFRRELGNGKFELIINGKSCKTIGNICMDMCMVDISQVNCAEGDEVIVFENFSQISKMAEALNTIPYEVLTGISTRVKRVYVQE
jgi:Alr-MurF fusion protein